MQIQSCCSAEAQLLQGRTSVQLEEKQWKKREGRLQLLLAVRGLFHEEDEEGDLDHW